MVVERHAMEVVVADCLEVEAEVPSRAEFDDVRVSLSMHLEAQHCPPVP